MRGERKRGRRQNGRFKKRRRQMPTRFRGGPMELKFHDIDLDDAVVATGGTVAATINIIPQGVTEITRVGRRCTITSINWRYAVNMPIGTASNSVDTCRVILYQDKQTNGATAAVLDILETADYQSFRNLANTGRFNILMDRTHTINPQGLAGDGTTIDSPAFRMDKTFYKKCNVPIEFSSTLGVIAEIRSNNLVVLLISQAGLVGFESKFRLRFSDG